MSALIIRLPAEKHGRFEKMARQCKVSVSNIVGEMAMILLADFGAETCFRIPASRGAGRADGGRYAVG
jgi:hypothetical protein